MSLTKNKSRKKILIEMEKKVVEILEGLGSKGSCFWDDFNITIEEKDLMIAYSPDYGFFRHLEKLGVIDLFGGVASLKKAT